MRRRGTALRQTIIEAPDGPVRADIHVRPNGAHVLDMVVMGGGGMRMSRQQAIEARRAIDAFEARCRGLDRGSDITFGGRDRLVF